MKKCISINRKFRFLIVDKSMIKKIVKAMKNSILSKKSSKNVDNTSVSTC